jgi:hypothetical protein
MSSAKTLLDIENKQAGRTVPNWRFSLAQYMGIAMFLLGAFNERFDWNVWVSLGIMIGYVIVFAVLLIQYAKNSIR